MVDERVPGHNDKGSLLEMIRSAGFGATDDVAVLADLGARVQEHRVKIGVSRADGATRSTTLWAAMQLDSTLRDTLERTGISARKLREDLQLRTDSFTDEPAPARLHSDFAKAMRSHLSQRRSDAPVTSTEVVSAILQSVQTSKGGRLPGYLGDVSKAIEALRSDASSPPGVTRTEPALFSQSVRDLVLLFGDDPAVTPGRIAAALQTPTHEQYANGTFLSASFPEGGASATFGRWCERVGSLYDVDEVRHSSHSVIDGRLFLAGLAVLDRPFALELDRLGIRVRLESELAVNPRVTDLLGGVSSEHVDPTEGIPLDRDRMGVAPYVSMLATVICDRYTPMPLSVGVFGEWGSGKSYFMGLLRGRIDAVSGSDDLRYWKDIRQIGFNAWHYADSNLWASLGDEIFRQLLDEPDPDTARQDALRKELGERFEQRKEIDAAAKQAHMEADRLRRDLETAVARRDATARDLVTAIARSSEFKKRSEQIWAMLGVHDAVDRERLLAEGVAGTLSELDSTRGVLRGRYGLLATIAAVLVLLAVAVATWLPADGAAWRSVVSGISVALAGATWVVTRARRGAAALHALARDIRHDVEEVVRERRAEELAEPVEKLQEAEAARERAQSQLAAVTLRVNELDRELADLAPGQRLYSFLADRVAAGDYTHNLGLVSTIRKDLGHLSDLMEDWRERAGKDEDAPRPIDRIVLYIDDLDRCSPQQVVAVLQAVHLLLALDLFVAVVGVDPRWLIRSLQREYPRLLDPPTRGENDGDGWDASPEDYLEKIFGIPFVLPGMDGHLKGVLQGIFRDSEDRISAVQESAAHAPDVEGETNTETEEGTTWAATDSSPVSPEPGSEAAAQDSGELIPPRPLTDAETEFLAALEPLIQTPREAKRLANVYRMVRSSKDLSMTSYFLGGPGRAGEFQAVIVLLGLLSAHARLLGAVLDSPPDPDPEAGISGGLMHRTAKGTWAEFVASLKPRRNGDSWSNAVVGPLTDTEAAAWLSLWSGLEKLKPKVTLPDLTPLQTWAPSIRRFSFVLPPPQRTARP